MSVSVRKRLPVINFPCVYLGNQDLCEVPACARFCSHQMWVASVQLLFCYFAVRQIPKRTGTPHTYLLTIGEISDRPPEAARAAGSRRTSVPKFIVETRWRHEFVK